MSQIQAPVIFDMNTELREERNSYLGFVQFASAIVGSIFFIISTQLASTNIAIDTGGIGVFLTGIVLSYILRKNNWLDGAAHTYLAGLTLGIALQVYNIGPDPAFFVLLILPVALAGIVVDQADIVWVVVYVILAAAVSTMLYSNLATAFANVFVPALAYAAVGCITYVRTWDLLERVRWTLDKQHKDNRRAEHFYDQSEELQKALLQVQHYSSKLEIVNKQLAEAQLKAESASKAKSTFLSNMSHELRTPLNVIIGYSSSMLNMPQMFQNKRISTAHRPYLELIEENGHYLLGLINDTLDLSKIEAGRLDLHCESTSLSEIFRGVLATSTGLLKGKPIQLRSNFPDDLPAVWADPMRVRQIILNLMSNAVKFTESGSVTLSAHVAGDFVEVAVTDTGIGIPEKALAVIFDRFQQAEKDTDRKYGGTGLGLDISKQLSLMHGGDLTVTSEPGRGSTFTVKLPISSQHVGLETIPLAGARDSVEPSHSQEMDDGEPQIVLLVEDDVNTRHLLRQSLEQAGHVVVDTSSGNEALELAEGLLPAVIILDVFLPDSNGWKLLEKLKANPETQPIPVIMCTADDDVPAAAHQLKPMYYLPKPITPDLVLDFVEEAMALNINQVEKQL